MAEEPVSEPADTSAELWMLRAKAYGRGGVASAEELSRLEKLEGRGSGGEERLRLASLAQPVGPEPVEGSSAAAAPPSLNDPPLDALSVGSRGDGSGDLHRDFSGSLSDTSTRSRSLSAGRSETKRAPRPQGVETSPDAKMSPDAETSPDADTSTGSAIGSSARRRWPIIIVAAAAILAVGLGVGWAIWGWDRTASALVAAHDSTRVEIENEQLYDPGTVVPMAEQHGVVIWRADRSDGTELCVIVTGSGDPRHGCVMKDDLADSVWPNVTATVPEGDERAGQQLVASLLPTPSGELVPYVQVWGLEVQDGWESQYSEEELSQLRAVEEAGYAGESLSILGYDGDSIVWTSWEDGIPCVLAPTEGGIAAACAETSEETITLTIMADGILTTYTVTQSEQRAPQLTIYKGVDAEYRLGTVDEPQFDDFFGDDPAIEDPAIDDKTGE